MLFMPHEEMHSVWLVHASVRNALACPSYISATGKGILIKLAPRNSLRLEGVSGSIIAQIDPLAPGA